MKVREEHIDRAREKLEDMEDNYLRERGWKHSCENPGSQWLWEKTDKNGRTYRCGKKTALSIQGDLCDDPPEIIVAWEGDGAVKGYIVYVHGFPIWLEANDLQSAQPQAKEALGLPEGSPDLPVYDSSEDEDA